MENLNSDNEYTPRPTSSTSSQRPADLSARFNENPEYAVEQLQRYILDVPLKFEFRPTLVTNLRHLWAALAREEHYPQNMQIQMEGSPWNNCEGYRTIFTGAITIKKKRQQLFFAYGKSFEAWRTTVQMNNANTRASMSEWDPDDTKLFKAEQCFKKSKRYRECSFSFMKEVACSIAKREKHDGELEDAHITREEAYEGILQHYNNSACCSWCGIGLVFLGDSGSSQYSPDRPDPPQTYLDGWVASCYACNRLFNNLSENARTHFMDVLIEKYDPYRHEVASRKLLVSEMKNIKSKKKNVYGPKRNV